MQFLKQMRYLLQKYPEPASRTPAFVAKLFERTERVERAYQSIMERHDGDPSGIEFRHATWLRWGIVLPDASEPGKTRVQYFSTTGLGRHDSFSTLEEAVEFLVASNYVVEDPGVLDKMAVRWRAEAATAPGQTPQACGG